MKGLLIILCLSVLLLAIESRKLNNGNKKPEENSSEEQKDPTGECGKCTDTDSYIAHKECNKFCSCSYDRRAWELECPKGLLFNAEKQYCDFPNRVQCKKIH